MEKYANQDAEEHLRAALELVQDEGERAGLLARLALAIHRLSHHGESIQISREAISVFQELENLEQMAEMYRLAALAAWWNNEIPLALEICQEGVETLKDAPPTPGLARLMAETCRAYQFNSLFDISREVGLAALALAESVGAVDAQVEALSTMVVQSGFTIEERINMGMKAVRLAEKHHLYREGARANNNLGYSFIFTIGDIYKAREHFDNAALLANKIGDRHVEVFHSSNVFDMLLESGEIQMAEQVYDRMEELQESILNSGMASNMLILSKLDLDKRMGKFNGLLARILDFQNQVIDSGDTQMIFQSFVLEYFVRMKRGQYLEAAKKLDQFLSNYDWRNHELTAYMLIAHCKAANLDGARKAFDQLTEINKISVAEEFSESFVNISLKLLSQAHLWALEEKWADCWQAFQQYFDMRPQWRWERARVRIDWAWARQQRGKPEDIARAKELLLEAHAEFEAMDSDGWAAHVDEQLEKIGGS
jgi:tetratricopeptide (TPR) repeat protein